MLTFINVRELREEHSACNEAERETSHCSLSSDCQKQLDCWTGSPWDIEIIYQLTLCFVFRQRNTFEALW